jgi:predicted transposase YdaD
MPQRDSEAHRFDKTIKKLFQTLPSLLVEWLTGQPPVEALNVEFPTVESRSADLVYRLPNDEIHHIELQSDNPDIIGAARNQ